VTTTGPAGATGATAATGATGAVETAGGTAAAGGTAVPGKAAATGATSPAGARGPTAAAGGAKSAGPDPLVLASRIGGLVDRGDWNGAARELGQVPVALRNQPEFTSLADRIRIHAENEKLLASARADLQSGKFQDAEDKARRLSNTELRDDARRVSEDAQKQLVNQLAARIQSEIGAGNAAQARQNLAAARKMYPSDPRWDSLEAAIRELEKPKAPECPPVPALAPDNTPPAYSGTPDRDFSWSGTLQKGCSIVLQGTFVSAGGQSSAAIPKFPADISQVAPGDVSLIDTPRADNGYRIVLRNDSAGQVTQIRFHWKRR